MIYFYRIVLCFIFIPVINVAQDNTFVVVKNNGYEKFEGYIQENDTIKNGFYYFFKDSATLYQSGFYEKNKMQGVWIIYYPSGRIKTKYTYNTDQKQGPFSHYTALLSFENIHAE